MMVPVVIAVAAFTVGFVFGVLLISMLAVAHHADSCVACARETA